MKESHDEQDITYMQKISNLLGVPMGYIQKLRDIGCLDETKVRNILIRSEYSRLRKEGYTVKKRMGKLREIYNIEMRQLQNIVHAKIRCMHYCKYCGRQITMNSVEKHDSVCPECLVNRKN